MLINNTWQKVDITGKFSIQTKGYATILYCNSLEKPAELITDVKTCQSINNYATNEKVVLDSEDKFVWLRTYEIGKLVDVAIYDGLGESGGGGTGGAVTVTSGNINVDNFPEIQTVSNNLDLQIQNGNCFQLSSRFVDVAKNGEVAIKFEVGSNPVKLTDVFVSTTFKSLETSVKTGVAGTVGALISIFNYNKMSAKITQVLANLLTNFSGGIDVLPKNYLEIVTGSGGGIRLGGVGSTSSGTILAPNTTYYFTAKNTGDSTGNLGVKINYCEV